MKNTISIDRIEGEIIVAENDSCEMINLTKEDFADPAVVGDCYSLGEDGRYCKNASETEKRRKQNIDLLKSLIKKK